MQRMRGWLDFSGGACECGWNYKKYAKNLAPDCAAVIRIKRQGLRQCLCHLSSSLHFSQHTQPLFPCLPRDFSRDRHTHVRTIREHYYYNIFKFLKLNENTTPSLIITAEFFPLMKMWKNPASTEQANARWRCHWVGKVIQAPKKRRKKKENSKNKQRKKGKQHHHPIEGPLFLALAQLKMRKEFSRLTLPKKKKEEYLES